MGKAALITGASAGLGVEFARLFAADGHDVVLVARRRERLEALAADLATKHGVKAHVIIADLMSPEAPAAVVNEVRRLGLQIEYLVNNAGFGTSGAFHTLDLEKELGEVQCNLSSLVELTGAFLPEMVARGRGRVLNVGSTAGFQAGPYMATYYATKAFVNTFTEALWYELRGTGVTATVSCPGPTATEFFATATTPPALLMLGVLAADEVALGAYRAMHAGRPVVIHGLKNRVIALAGLVTPRFIWRAIVGTLNKSSPPWALKAGA
jgi:short-subunit dehydrogenase